MSIVGSRVTVTHANDPTKVGRKGEIVLETANTLLLQTATGTMTLEKAGTILQMEGTEEPLAADDIRGRLEDRIREGRR